MLETRKTFLWYVVRGRLPLTSRGLASVADQVLTNFKFKNQLYDTHKHNRSRKRQLRQTAVVRSGF